MTKKLYIKTYGCQMNVYDSGKMADVMKPLGYDVAEDQKDADVVVLNTCHIREKAAEKLYSDLGRIKREKDRMWSKGKKMTIVVAGCVGQAEGEHVFDRAPFVDVVVGPQSYHSLPDLVMKSMREKRTMALDFVENQKFDSLTEIQEHSNPSALLTIQEGCDKFCTFCVVPYTRGAEYSRPVPEIYREALALAQSGAREIILLGQNVNAFHGKGLDGDIWNLGKLIKHLAKIKGIERIRYTTSHPMDMHDELYDAHANEPKCMPFVHLPVQAGSDKILKAMNRKHTTEEYKRVVDKLRKARPDIGFSSDFIVGFPGESDEDFKETLKLVEEVFYAQAYSFKYSPRPGTPAAENKTQIPEDVKSARLQELQALLGIQQKQFNKDSVGKIMPVLFEKKGRETGQLIGKSPYLQSVHVKAPEELIGSVMQVEISKSKTNSLEGNLLDLQCHNKANKIEQNITVN